MTKPDTLIVDGHAFSWQRLCELRRQQLETWEAAQASQPGTIRVEGWISDRRPNAPPPRGTASRLYSPITPDMGTSNSESQKYQ
jgi:hypothetical protein